jgi:cyclopropane fatty-acyl-phospholipid synthase-like methyltransferase
MHSAPFDAIAQSYDQSFTETATGQYQRERTHYFTAKAQLQGPVLELNCGTGVDAVWLAQQGHTVLATDISEAMCAITLSRATQAKLEDKISTRQVNAGRLLAQIGPNTQFGSIFSNFGGLNCLSPNDLSILNQDAAKLLPEGGQMVLVMIGRFCWWETLYFLAKGKFKTAFRRRSKEPVSARLNADTFVDTWYYSARELSVILLSKPIQSESGYHLLT